MSQRAQGRRWSVATVSLSWVAIITLAVLPKGHPMKRMNKKHQVRGGSDTHGKGVVEFRKLNTKCIWYDLSAFTNHLSPTLAQHKPTLTCIHTTNP